MGQYNAVTCNAWLTAGSFNDPNNRDRVSIISQFFGCWESKLAYRADQGHQASKTGNSKAYLVVLWFVRWQMKLQAFKLLFVVLLTFSHDYGVEGWRRRRRRRWTPPPPRQCTVSGRKSASFSFTKTVLILFVLEMQFSKFVRVSYKILCPRARASISRLTLGRWKEVDRSLNHMHPLTEHPTA